MNSNITLPGLETFTVRKSEEVAGTYYLWVEMEKKAHRCPNCGSCTMRVHDYRTQKIQHTRLFGRRVYVLYRKRRYVCRPGCGKRFYEDNSLVERYGRQSQEFKQALGTEKQHWYLDYYLKKSDYLKRAYQLKEAYRLWFETAKVKGPYHLSETKAHLYKFYDLVKESGVGEFEKAIGTLQNWQKEIMNSFGFNLHNGYIEGMNNQTKVLKRNAFGFRRFDRFRSKILLHHQYKNLDTRVA